jgi:hypothetical protein
MSNPLKGSIKGAMNNCTAKNGPASCRYHSKQFKQNPELAKFKSMADIFHRVEEDLAPNEYISAAHKSKRDKDAKRLAFHFKAGDVYETMPKEYKNAVHGYADEYGSNKIRTVLMNPGVEYNFNGVSMDSIRKDIASLDGTIDKYGDDVSSTELWRGVKSLKYELENVSVGSTFSSPSFTSTSEDIETAISFTNEDFPILIKVSAKKGFRLGGYHTSEREVLLARDTQFRVKKITENVHVEKSEPKFGESPTWKGITLIEVEEI